MGAADSLLRAQRREETESEEKTRFSFAGRRFPLDRKDALPIVLLVAVYAIVAFWGLGDREAPRTFYRSGEGQAACIIDLGQERQISGLIYYSGISTGNYRFESSSDGRIWDRVTILEQPYDEVLKWHKEQLDEEITARYLRVLAQTGTPQLGEVALFDRSGSMLVPVGTTVLTDEQYIVPDSPTYLNGSYFDEIYHVRTALEFREDLTVYETSHPPLGKMIILLGILLFGPTPFGWRFMGTLFGVLMLIPFYVLLKNLFGKRAVAICGTALFAFDFMHFVQTRIATIDTYGVFFIILAYLFMYRWLTRPQNSESKKDLWQLFLSGLFFGLGAASKWTVVFGSTGLAVLYFVDLFLRRRDLSTERGPAYYGKILACGILFFIIIPAIIYCLSYLPFADCSGIEGGWRMIFKRDFYRVILKNQQFMYSYHSDLVAEHPYAAPWWMWILNIRPILYWLEYFEAGMKSAFAAWANPLVCWGGLGAMIAMFFNFFRRKDPRALFIIVSFFAQLAPWMAISRLTFEYHYFPSIVFLVLAISYTFNDLVQFRPKGGKWLIYGTTGLSLCLFVLFYPVLTGITVSQKYCLDFLKWFPSWPFG